MYYFNFTFQPKKRTDHLLLGKIGIILYHFGWLTLLMGHRLNLQGKNINSFLYLLSSINSFVVALKMSPRDTVCVLSCNVLAEFMAQGSNCEDLKTYTG